MSEAALSEFGLLPLLLGFLWWRNRDLGSNVLLRFTFVYGGASIVLAPVLGTWSSRLIGYAWPIFFVALPMLFEATSQRALKPSRGLAALAFLVVHLFVFWQAYRWPWLTQSALNLISWAIGFFLLRCWLAGEGKSPDRPNVGPPRQIMST